MKKLIAFIFLLPLTACVLFNNHQPKDEEKTIYKNWVLSRCLSKVVPSSQKQDALNTASAYLESSHLPLDAFLKAEPLITKFLEKNYSGSIKGTFNTKKCIDLYTSPALEKLYQQVNRT